MSNISNIDSNQLTLLDVLGFPSSQMLFNFQSKSIIYSLGSNIISYDLTTNSKTFVQYLSHEIVLLKFLDPQEKLLISIDNSLSPMLCIWELPHFEQIYQSEILITSEKDFYISNIYLEQMYQDVYLICITSKIGINYLFVLKNEIQDNNGYNIELLGKISGINEEIFGFKIFFNCNDAIFLLENNLVYYNIDLDQENMNEKFKIDFPNKLLKNSLHINRDINIIAFLNLKGSCLIYDQNGNNKPSINPIGQEYFVCCKFEKESICLGTNNGNIYIYNIYDNKPKIFINYNSILKIRHNYQINNLSSESEYNKYYTSEEYDLSLKLIYFNEEYDEIFLNFADNSILLSPLSLLTKNQQNKINDFSRYKNYFYSFNHSQKIDDIIIKDNENLVLYSCSKDQKIIKYNIEYETNKLINSFFNLKEILSNNKFSSPSSNNRNNYNIDKDNNMVYISVLKCHPIYSNKLFAGDNKGFLYLFDTKENKFQYKKLILETYEIVSLDFSPDGNLLCIGFDTGCQFFCSMKNNCQICLKLNDDYMPVEESELRKLNNNVICYCYFFKNKEKHDNCILYLKNNYTVEYCNLYYNNNSQLNKRCIKSIKLNNQILDIKMHISENYIIVLNNINQIVICQITTGKITAVIDLNNKVRKVNNIQIDNSGLFLAVLCEINDIDDVPYSDNILNNNEKDSIYRKNSIIIFEIGTGNVASCVNYINPINKMIFDNDGNYLIIAGVKGELSLWKLSENMSYNIKNILNEMISNPYFWDDYEIIYDNSTTNFKNDIINNSNYVINKKGRNLSSENQIKHDIQFNSKTHRKDDIKNSLLSNNISLNSNTFTTNINYRRNRNKNQDKSSDYKNDFTKYNSINDYSKSNMQSNDFSHNMINNRNDKISLKNTSNNYNSLTNYGKDSNIKNAPLLIDSNKLKKLKEKEKEKEKLVEKNNEIDNNLNENPDEEFKNVKIDSNKLNDDDNNKNNDIDNNNNKYINNQFLRNKENNIIEEKNNFIRKGVNDNIFSDENNIIKTEKINNNINNNYIESKLRNNNNIQQNGNEQNINSKIRINSYKKEKNRLNTARPNLNKKNFNSFNYQGFNTIPDKIPKLNYINIVNNNNTENNYFQTYSNKNSQDSYLFSFKEKITEERQRNIKNAINQLLDNSIPLNSLEKEKNIQLTIQSKRDENVNKDKLINNEKNITVSVSQNDINEDFIVINNQKILKDEFTNEPKTETTTYINNEIRKNFGMDKFKKYPEPDDIDENLVSSNVEPIPDLEQHNKIQKIEMDDINNQFEKNNNINLNEVKKEEINNLKNVENKDIYFKNQINNKDNNLGKYFDEENE